MSFLADFLTNEKVAHHLCSLLIGRDSQKYLTPPIAPYPPSKISDSGGARCDPPGAGGRVLSPGQLASDWTESAVARQKEFFARQATFMTVKS